ncbi:hypothetical protein [Nitrosomonas sp. Nm58]|uniref:hypothetical protein n=1 Tax=Nitrosomonas sp. Nm58 TaxID=200126 RepID=UPI00089B5D44|nr:hypothetical protein [Nitrosomonas sp. Nm58]SDY52315.1 hypothetical protein SAMN05421754_10125 [Nitrosomonas sp. Nm58]
MSPLSRRSLLITIAIFATIIAAWGVELLLSLPAHWPFAHSQPGHVLGWLGLAVILLTYVYPWKKRHAPSGTWPKKWFMAHMLCGSLGPMLILIHSGWHLHAGVAVLALLAMGGAAISGIIGKTIHSVALRMLSSQQRTLTEQGLSQEQIGQVLDDAASQESMFRMWQIIHAPLAAIFIVLTILHIMGAIFFTGF